MIYLGNGLYSNSGESLSHYGVRGMKWDSKYRKTNVDWSNPASVAQYYARRGDRGDGITVNRPGNTYTGDNARKDPYRAGLVPRNDANTSTAKRTINQINRGYDTTLNVGRPATTGHIKRPDGAFIMDRRPVSFVDRDSAARAYFNRGQGANVGKGTWAGRERVRRKKLDERNLQAGIEAGRARVARRNQGLADDAHAPKGRGYDRRDDNSKTRLKKRSTVDRYKTKVSNAVGDAVKSVKDSYRKFTGGDGLDAGDFKRAGKKAYNSASKSVKGAYKSAKKGVNSAYNSAKSGINSAYKSAQKSYNNFTGGDGLDAGDFKRAGKKAYNSASKSVKGAYKSAKKGVNSAYNSAKGAVNEAYNDVSKSASKAKKKAKKKIKEIRSALGW